LPEPSAGAQQVFASCNQLGQSAWESRVALREAMPARTFIRGNSGDSTCLEMNDSHESPTVRGAERFSAKDSFDEDGHRHQCFPCGSLFWSWAAVAGLVEWLR
jgi:hypothetical protein